MWELFRTTIDASKNPENSMFDVVGHHVERANTSNKHMHKFIQTPIQRFQSNDTSFGIYNIIILLPSHKPK
jgi:hypothetical protein